MMAVLIAVRAGQIPDRNRACEATTHRAFAGEQTANFNSLLLSVHAIVLNIASWGTKPRVELCDRLSQCYHHACEETSCWFQKAKVVGCGEEGDYLVLHRSRTDGDSKSCKAAKHQHEQLRGVRRSQRSSPANPLTSRPFLGAALQSESPTVQAYFFLYIVYSIIVQYNCNVYGAACNSALVGASDDYRRRVGPTEQTICKIALGEPPWANHPRGAQKLHGTVSVLRCKRRPTSLGQRVVRYPLRTYKPGTSEPLRWHQGATGSALLRPVGSTLGIRGHGL